MRVTSDETVLANRRAILEKGFEGKPQRFGIREHRRCSTTPAQGKRSATLGQRNQGRSNPERVVPGAPVLWQNVEHPRSEIPMYIPFRDGDSWGSVTQGGTSLTLGWHVEHHWCSRRRLDLGDVEREEYERAVALPVPARAIPQVTPHETPQVQILARLIFQPPRKSPWKLPGKLPGKSDRVWWQPQGAIERRGQEFLREIDSSLH